MTARRLRSMGWIATLVVCAALVMVMAFRVNALRSQVHQSNIKIIALKQETMYLETEFETRASQQQLKTWNDVEFGYAAPSASQYLDTERQLAAYAKPAEPGAPEPVRMASADQADTDQAGVFPAMVSPLSGKPMGGSSDPAAPSSADGSKGSAKTTDPTPGVTPSPSAHRIKTAATVVAAVGLAGLGERLATVRHAARPGEDAAPVLRASPSAHRAAGKLAGKSGPHAKARTGALAKTKPARTKASAAKAMASLGARAGDRLASLTSTGAHSHGIAPQHRPAKGSSLIKLALKDLKAVK